MNRRVGQSRPRHSTVMSAARGARTLSRVTRAPVAVNRPWIRTIGNGCSGRATAFGAASAGAGGMAAGGGARAALVGAGVAAGVGSGVVSGGVGVGVGVGVAVAIGVGVAVGTGEAATTAVGCERASTEPASFLSVSRTRNTEPTSSFATRYRADVAPVIRAQDPVGFGQRSHAQAATGCGSPVHTAFATNWAPTCGVPLITGP